MNAPPPLARYALYLGDDALVLAQRLTGWLAHAPELEEDVALANIALDLLGQARILLDHAGRLEGAGRDEDALAYLRTDRQFHNALLVELENGDFAQTILRQLFFAAYQLELYRALTDSRDETLAGLAGKAVKEVAYHLDHAAEWTLRLGDGTEESHRRAVAAVELLWPYTHELFEADELTDALAAEGYAVDPAALRTGWLARVTSVLAEATLTVPADGWRPSGGRRGVHTELLGYLLAEMQSLARAHPGASW